MFGVLEHAAESPASFAFVHVNLCSAAEQIGHGSTYGPRLGWKCDHSGANPCGARRPERFPLR
ncbi:hypothetical protein FHX76_001992 [Lysinibacter cavernae]|uniref:Uncharacterized protein n=1 Tax=Lysinibacter cavernae TaxID=1640652 RepID=A0A7X5TT02_9MICO|nr:hypothetical protein [Lysinibacter cavernae]